MFSQVSLLQLFYSDFSKAFQKLEELGTSNLVSVA
jgi:hypothetical protein